MLEQVIKMMTDYEEFKKAFYRQSGIDLNLYKEKQMKRRITSLVEKNGHNGYMSFFFAMQADRELYNSFINYLTINVSEFYRNPAQWELFENVMIPMLEKIRGNLQNVKIWSSACSTGDEPYTLVMILNRYLPLSRIRIKATDIDMDAINKAKQGIYPERSIKDLPFEFLNRYFKKIGDGSYKIIDEVKNCVDFSQLNLLEYDYPKNLDLIVCRNVLIYFTEEAKANIYKAFNHSLVNGGILFLGSTEQIIGSLKYGFKPIQTFFYQKVENVE